MRGESWRPWPRSGSYCPSLLATDARRGLFLRTRSCAGEFTADQRDRVHEADLRFRPVRLGYQLLSCLLIAEKKISEVSLTKFAWVVAKVAAQSTPDFFAACSSRSSMFFRTFS